MNVDKASKHLEVSKADVADDDESLPDGISDDIHEDLDEDSEMDSDFSDIETSKVERVQVSSWLLLI
jgi:hypothetical protein